MIVLSLVALFLGSFAYLCFFKRRILAIWAEGRQSFQVRLNDDYFINHCRIIGSICLLAALVVVGKIVHLAASG